MIAKRIDHKGQCAHAQTQAARRACRKAMIAALATTITTEEATVQIASGHAEQIGPHEVEVFVKPGFGRRDTNAPQRWTYVVGGHIDTMPDTTWATGEEALAEARRRLTPGAVCGTCDHALDTWGQCNHCR